MWQRYQSSYFPKRQTIPLSIFLGLPAVCGCSPGFYLIEQICYKWSNLFDASVSDWTMCLHTDIPTWWHNSTEERGYCSNKQTNKKKRRRDKPLLKEQSDSQRLYLIMIITVSDKGLVQPPLLVCRQVTSGPNTMHTVWLRWGTHVDLIAHTQTDTHNTCWYTEMLASARSKETKTVRAFSCCQWILPTAPPPLSKPHSFPKLVLLIKLLYNACSAETLRGIPLRLVLTLAGSWPTYTRPFEASMWGIIVPHSSRVFFL